MDWRLRTFCAALAALGAILPGAAWGQGISPGFSGMGQPLTAAPATMPVATSGIPATGASPIGAAVEEAPPAPIDTSVSFIDSAVPRSMLRLRFDANYTNHSPSRAEYLFPKGGLPGSPGMLLPETNVSMQELRAYLEVALIPQFSFFTEQPWRWVNPEVNANETGPGDFNFGVKWAVISEETMVTSVQLRAYFPTAQHASLGTDHYAFEPSLLFNYRLTNFLALEGEFRYWLPIGGTEFEGDLIRYGLGLVYGMHAAGEIWVTPVAEVVGWTVLDGLQMTQRSPGTFAVESARGTILNAYLGVRLGLGAGADIYAGYGRGITGDPWFHDTARVELRLFF